MSVKSGRKPTFRSYNRILRESVFFWEYFVKYMTRTISRLMVGSIQQTECDKIIKDVKKCFSKKPVGKISNKRVAGTRKNLTWIYNILVKTGSIWFNELSVKSEICLKWLLLYSKTIIKDCS